jgi:hypothetical protein
VIMIISARNFKSSLVNHQFFCFCHRILSSSPVLIVYFIFNSAYPIRHAYPSAPSVHLNILMLFFCIINSALSFYSMYATTYFSQCCCFFCPYTCLPLDTLLACIPFCERTSPAEPVFLNVYGAPELISRNEFRLPM